MALFKIFRGPESGLNAIPCHNGYAYFTEDTGNLYIDIGDTPGSRVQVNAHAADVLRSIAADGTVTEVDIDDILLKTATLTVAQGGTGRNTLTVNAILLGNGANSVKMVAVSDNQFVLGDSTNGVKGVTAATARQTLDVYDKTTVDNKITDATSVAYSTTLNVAGWTAVSGKFQFTYSNTNLKCGKNGDVCPIITYTSNQTEYSKINKATATPGVGIVFEIDEKPSSDIGIIIIDNK